MGGGFSGGGFSDGGGSSIEGAWSGAVVVAVSSRRRFVGRFIGRWPGSSKALCCLLLVVEVWYIEQVTRILLLGLLVS